MSTKTFYYVIYTSAYGLQTIQFETADDRDAWAEGQDDYIESFYAIDCAGPLLDAYLLSIGPQD